MQPPSRGLEAVAGGLDLPQPERVRILEEIALDLEALETELIRSGASRAEAEARARQILLPDEGAALALVDLHEPPLRRFLRQFPDGALVRVQSAVLVTSACFALGWMTVDLVRNDLLRSPSPFLWAILLLAVGIAVTAGRKAFQLFVAADHRPSHLRSGTNLILVASGAALVLALAGLVVDLHQLAAGFEFAGEGRADRLVPWLLDTAVLTSAGLLTALFGGLCWFVLAQKIHGVERAFAREHALFGPSSHNRFQGGAQR